MEISEISNLQMDLNFWGKSSLEDNEVHKKSKEYKLAKLSVKAADYIIEASITPDEEKLINQLGGHIWNQFENLPFYRQSDKIDFADAVHKLQRIVGVRPLFRTKIFKSDENL